MNYKSPAPFTLGAFFFHALFELREKTWKLINFFAGTPCRERNVFVHPSLVTCDYPSLSPLSLSLSLSLSLLSNVSPIRETNNASAMDESL